MSPEGRGTRPTTERVREAIFNSLGSAGLIDGARVLDLWAGTGALGIEALSRGAERCVFVERDRTAVGVLRDNVRTLGLDSRSTVVTGDALAAAAGPADIVVADPPYGDAPWGELLQRVTADLVVTEGDRAVEGEGWEQWRARRYGRTWVTFLRRTTGEPTAM